MVSLQGNVAGVRFGEFWHLAELALGDAVVEVFAADDILEILHSIDLVLTLFGADEQPDVVPFAGWFGGIQRLAGFGVSGRLIKAVEPAAALRVGSFGVVLKLEFRSGR